MKTIPTYIHGVLDYVVGLALLLAPNLFGFADEGGAAVMVPRVIGVMILGMAVLTRYELGLFKLIPMPVHLVIDYVVPLILAASPWLFGFNEFVYLPHLILGILELGAVWMTDPNPARRTDIHHQFDERHRHAH